jgi:hypothetical protein
VFRFTIRDVLWLTVVVAACLAVFLTFRAERATLIKRAQQAEEEALRATEMLLGPQNKLRPQSQSPFDAPKQDPNASQV